MQSNTFDQPSGAYHYEIKLISHMSGLGANGTRYQSQQTLTESVEGNAGAFAATEGGEFTMIAQGPGNNFVSRYLVHISETSAGPTLEFSHSGDECR